MRFFKVFSGGLVFVECKDRSVFIFVLEEIKKKFGNKCLISFFVVFFVLVYEVEVVECEI